MTRRERLTRVIRGYIPDRPAVKLWGAGSEHLPLPAAYAPVRLAALERTDLVLTTSSPFDLHFGAERERVLRVVERPSASPDWMERVTTVHTPLGDLESVAAVSTRGHPGYRRASLLKEPEDIKRVLAVPYQPIPFDASPFLAAERDLGDAGVVMYGLDHAMYGLQRLTGSERLAIWSVDCEELLLDAVSEYSRRIREQVRTVLQAGLKPVFAWSGPELCIPPLMSLDAFDRYVAAFDTPLIDEIHAGGGFVWVHCHGRMRALLHRFREMGVDVLNPIEPPPMGDVTLSEAFETVGNAVALEGNIETHDFMTEDPAVFLHTIHAALDAGKGRRHILCPSSGYAEAPEPSERHIRNLLLYVEEAVRYAEERCRS